MHSHSLLLILLTVAFFACNEPTPAIKLTAVQAEAPPVQPYPLFLLEISNHRKELRRASEDSIRQYLYKTISEDMAGYWLGTRWDYNGITRVPKQGSIACGYFVTTVLQDIGMPVQRVKMAQQPSSFMINTLCIKPVRRTGWVQAQDYLLTQPNGSVFIAGLDYHTGFVVKDSTGIYFLHSSYLYKRGVVKEALARSLDFKGSKSFMLGSLTGNTQLLKQWINR